ALKAGEWFRRGRLFMVSPVRGDYRRSQADFPLIVLSRFPGPAQGFEVKGRRIRQSGDLASFVLLKLCADPSLFAAAAKWQPLAFCRPDRYMRRAENQNTISITYEFAVLF
ncbi:hypothetical protein, partial [Bradyrhizobium sp.]